ncbi:MAG: PH domain-containing protein [Verrucomicrobiota bacterium]
MNQENSLWKGSPSQWLNLGPFTAALVAAGGIVIGAVLSGPFFPFVLIGLVLPAAYMLWRYLVVRTEVFELTSERLRFTRGIINQKIDEIELYRVKDSQMVRPWWMRLTGLATILLQTSDRTLPHLEIPAIRGGEEVRELLRKHVELERDRKRVRETDFDEVGDEHSDLP